jgi:ribonuclease-3
VLGFLVARVLYDRHPTFSEGELSKVRAHVVSRRSCAVVAVELGLDRRLEAFGAVTEDLRRSGNVLAALMEALIAAMYLEYGIDRICEPVVAAFEARIQQALTVPVDHKTALQEELAKSGRRIEYVTINVDGPPHERTFTCAAVLDGEQIGAGTGRTKKEAEQQAARQTLERLGIARISA